MAAAAAALFPTSSEIGPGWAQPCRRACMANPACRSRRTPHVGVNHAGAPRTRPGRQRTGCTACKTWRTQAAACQLSRRRIPEGSRQRDGGSGATVQGRTQWQGAGATPASGQEEAPHKRAAERIQARKQRPPAHNASNKRRRAS
eukprot:180525-Chlamydomonas_euryale.AAC.12